ncbi:MAG: protein kinase, partial [Acidobacteriota bacterium]
MIGQTLSHFKIVAHLGKGGMGEVYRAEDTSLGRQVAIKVLPPAMADDPDRLARFEREAHAASALNHPGICTIHELGRHHGRPFLVMELLEGQTLQERFSGGSLPPDRVIDIGLQIAEALDAAHSKGLVHRDIKPGNLFVTDRGDIKILDFGLVKTFDEALSIDSKLSTELAEKTLTREGSTIGTVAYMSPEQARGDALDPRSDLFSLGVVLYELASGHRPFDGSTSAVIFSEILGKDPLPVTQLEPGVPAGVAAIIGRCLEKDPDLRYQSAADLRADLKRQQRDTESQAVIQAATQAPKLGKGKLWLAVGALILSVALAALVFWRRDSSEPSSIVSPEMTAERRTSVAVLPLQNMGADTSNEYLRLAVPDEITNTLARAPTLSVRPVATAAKYAETPLDPAKAGAELAAENIVTGQYYRVGEQLQITLEAVDVRNNEIVWRESLIVPADNLLDLRNQVTNAVRQGLLPQLGAATEESLKESQPQSDEAYLLYARSLSMSTDPSPNATAIEMLEKSVRLDPEFAPAWAKLALRYYYDGQYSDGGRKAFRLSQQAAQAAIEIDPANLEAATYLIQRRIDKGDLEGGFVASRELLKHRPDSVAAIFARSYVYRFSGMLDEALADCNRAYALDPTDKSIRSCALAFLQNDDVERARDFANLDSGSDWTTGVLARTYLQEGSVEEAQRLLGEIKESELYKLEAEIVGRCHNPSDEAMATVEKTVLLLPELRLDDPEPRYWFAAELSLCGHRD